ncbi:MAG: galactokinase [Acidobacteria bacterium]|nr:galactokinase [Acidobacteriota bacterium]
MRERLLEALPETSIVARAPGRVNIIGEHTDYNGFPVLPMAIDRAVWIAAAPTGDDTLVVRNVDDDRYPAETINLLDLPSREPRGTWVDYVVAAARRRVPESGLELVVVGDIPAEAGLSSSSALVVASFLALSESGDRALLAEEARLGERYVGTLSGGMDQAISLLGTPGNALRIDFRPVRVKPVTVPEDIAIVVAHSGVHAAKSGAAREAYNARVHECLSAARQLGAPEGGLLADVPVSRRADLAAIDDPLLQRRAGFVFAEARRVDEAVRALQYDSVEVLGELLNASHRGLRDEYDVSHPAVDDLVRRARVAGAAGARVVGAGFGGCVVAVCRREQAGAIRAALGPDAWVFRPAAGASRETL